MHAASVPTQAVEQRLGNAVEIESLTKVYGKGATQVRAVDGISLNIPPGQILGLLGPNGAGKTTTIKSGTLEQIYLSPLPAWLVAAAGRVLATVLETAFVVGIMSAIVYVMVPFHLAWRWQALIPIAFIAIGSVGYSLLEGGLTLIWKRVEMIHELALGLMAFFSGALLPLDLLPRWMADIGRFAPISQGVVGLRGFLVNGSTWLPANGAGSLVWTVAISLAWLLLGIVVFNMGESIARKHGSLGRY